MLIDFRDKGREEERERGRAPSMWERNMDRFPLFHLGLSPHLSVCPDQESNSGLFRLWDDAPTNWATAGQGLQYFFDNVLSQVLELGSGVIKSRGEKGKVLLEVLRSPPVSQAKMP